MGTDIRPETSKKNDYWISKHRYYELLHWCRQYDEWWKEKLDNSMMINSKSIISVTSDNSYESIVEKANLKNDQVNKKILLLTDTIKETDKELYDYILCSVTKGKGYTYLKEVKDIPCSKNYFYNKYRKFFWLLDKKHD